MDYSDYNTEEFNTKALDQKEIVHNLNFNSSKLNMVVPADIDDDHDESEVRETVNSMTNDDSLVVIDENNIN